MNFTEQEAVDKISEYLDEGLKLFPPLKGFGQKILQFAIDEPEMYQLLFCTKREGQYDEYLSKWMQWERIVPLTQATFELNEADARWLIKNLTLYAHGLATLFASSTLVMTEEEMSETLGRVCRGLVMQLKATPDSRTGLVPGEKETELGSLNEYMQGKSRLIIGYGDKGQIFRIRIDAILYFEAIGEKVFAYTKTEVFEIRQRLYKIEEDLKDFTFVRASKSLLINLKKVSKIRSSEGGRGLITMTNGEEVVANRSYYGSLKERIMEG